MSINVTRTFYKNVCFVIDVIVVILVFIGYLVFNVKFESVLLRQTKNSLKFCVQICKRKKKSEEDLPAN